MRSYLRHFIVGFLVLILLITIQSWRIFHRTERALALDAPLFTSTWGWGVQDGTPAFQVCTSGCQAGISGSGNGQFAKVGGIGVDASGNIFVMDAGNGGNNRVEKFSNTGTFLTKWGSTGSAEGQFKTTTAVGIAVDKTTGDVYVPDNANNRVEKFDNSGVFISTWGWGVQDGTPAFQVCTSGCQAGISGSGNGQFHDPLGIAVDASGNVYVGDLSNNRIEKFDSAGTYVTQWTTGTFPEGIAINSSGNIIVAQIGLNNIGIYTNTGTFVSSFSSTNARGIAVDAHDRMYVTNESANIVNVYDISGTLLVSFGSLGSGEGQFGGGAPFTVALDSTGNIFTSDTDQVRIEKFAALVAPSTPTPASGTVRRSSSDIPKRRPEDITPPPTPTPSLSPTPAPSPSSIPTPTPSPSVSPVSTNSPQVTPSETPAPTQIVLAPIASPELPSESPSIVQAIEQTFSNLIDTVTNTVAPIAAAPIATTATAAAVAAAAAGIATGFAQNGVVATTHGFFQIIGIKRKTRVWGVVYDSATKHPIPFVKVSLLDGNGRVLETRFSDRDGRYGFLTSPTSLHQEAIHVSIHAEHPGYTFPSARATVTSDYIVYDRLYKGDLLTITKATVLNFSIPMDPTAAQHQSIGIFGVSLLGTLGDKILSLGFYLGCVAVPVSYLLDPSYKNLIIGALFIGTNAFRLLAVYRPYGVIKDAATGKLLSYALVTLNDLNGTRVAFTVSDEYGRFILSGPAGSAYTLTAYTPANAEVQRSIHISISKLFGRGWVTKTVRV